VTSFRLSERARTDLVAIYERTAATFGEYQADAYHSGLERSFGLLADFPQIGAAVDDLAPGYRRFRFQSHLIFYTAEPSGVVIRTVLTTPATSARPCSTSERSPD
jgi:toxin ParE1/3/4